MVINNDMELEIPASIVSIIKVQADIIDDDKTIKTFEELTKILKFTKISVLYPLFTKTNCTKINTHMSISDIVYKIFISLCKKTTSMDNLVENYYLEIFYF